MYWEQVKKYKDSREQGYTYFGAEAENFKGGGIELEIDTTASIETQQFREQVAEILLTHSQCNHYFVEKDSSLAKGMELITQPHTIEAMRTFLAEAMPDILARVTEAGAENFCSFAGLHIHIGKNVFGDTYDEQKESLSKLLYFVSHNIEKFFILGNRTQTFKCQFPRPNLTIEKAREKVDNEYNPETNKRVSRDQAINLKQPNTVEFRAMATTTEIGVLRACVELWWHLANKSVVITWEDANDWDKWFEDSPQVVKEYIEGKLC